MKCYKLTKPTKISLAGFIKSFRSQIGNALPQPLLDTTKHFIDQYWHDLSDFNKHLFTNKYRSMWMAFRHPMPYWNAQILTTMLASNQLHAYSGYKTIQLSNNKKTFEIIINEKTIKADYIIDASGTPTDINQLESTLIKNLIATKFIQPYKFGGVKINRDTLQIQGVNNVFVIGQLTQGTLFYVSALERILLHSLIITKNIINELNKEIINHVDLIPNIGVEENRSVGSEC